MVVLSVLPKMITAHVEGEKVHIDNYDPSMGVPFCPDGHKLVVKKGSKRAHHFAHKNIGDCMYACNKGDWHIGWQSRFPAHMLEIGISDGNKRHVADALSGDTVIEFRHSHIDGDIKERENFYTNLGYNLLWVFDCSRWEYKSTWKYRGNMVGDPVGDMVGDPAWKISIEKRRGPSHPLYARYTGKVWKMLDFGRHELLLVEKQGKIIEGVPISLPKFDERYGSKGDLRPFHHHI